MDIAAVNLPKISLKADGMSTKLITKYTDLSLEEIEKLP